MTHNEKNTNKTTFTELPIYTTIEPQSSSETLSETDITSTKTQNIEDQQEEVELISENYFESIFNLAKPLNANNSDENDTNDTNDKHDNNILNDTTLTKDMVISAVDSLIIDLNNDIKVESTTFLRPEVPKTDRENVQTNTTDLISAVTDDSLSKKVITSTILRDLEDQRGEDVEMESYNFKSILNPMTPLYTINNTKNIMNDEKLTKDKVISAIDNILIDMKNDVKVDLTTLPRPETRRTTHREGVRMNTTALRREMHIKKRLQNNKHK